MKPRLDYYNIAQDGIRPLQAMETYLADCGLGHALIDLVKTRASQINGCAFCIAMHTKDALAQGEGEQRLFLLDAWHESPVYTDRERAALAWTDALTRISETRAPDTDFEALRAHFSDKEIVDLTLVIATINAWNRLAISMRAVPKVHLKAAAA